ncbi:hypothetical protein GGR79_000336 [Xanthomonas arboricola]|nr:hypothetical protein [Xanthomonas arboricola]
MASIHAPKRRCQALLRPMAGALSRGGISADRAFAAAVALLVAAAAPAVAGHERVPPRRDSMIAQNSFWFRSCTDEHNPEPVAD